MSKHAILTCLLTMPTISASPVMTNAKHAAASLSAPPVLILKQFPSTEFATTVHILATPAPALLLPVPLASQDST